MARQSIIGRVRDIDEGHGAHADERSCRSSPLSLMVVVGLSIMMVMMMVVVVLQVYEGAPSTRKAVL